MAGGSDLGALRVRDVMASDPEALDAGERLAIAEDLMRLARVRHLPVIDARGRVIGIVSQRDLFRAALGQALRTDAPDGARGLGALHVAEVMSRDVAMIGPEASVVEAAQRMRSRGVGCLPVVEEEELVGIVTEADFVGIVATGGGPPERAGPGRSSGC